MSLKKNPHFSYTQTPTAIIWRINLPEQEPQPNLDKIVIDEKKESEDQQCVVKQGQLKLQNTNNKKMTGQKVLSQIIQHVDCKLQVPFSSQKVLQRRYQATRKISEWILKYQKKGVDDIAEFIQEDKEMVKLWLHKKLKSQSEKQRLLDKIKMWVVYNCSQLPESVILKIGSKFLEYQQMQQANLNANQKQIHDQSSQYMNGQQQQQQLQCNLHNKPPAIMIHNTAPGRKKYKKKEVVEFDTSALQKIEINFKLKNGSRIQERIFWDNSDGENIDKMYTFAYHFIVDYLKDKNLATQVSEQDVSNYCLKIVKQIMAQSNKQQDILKVRQTLNQFDATRIQSDPELQEELIKVKIILRDQNRKIFYSDQFEWDMYSDFMDVEKFALILCNDMDFDLVYATEIQTQMRRQIIYLLNKQLQKLADFYPMFSENYDSETFSRLREKSYMKKRILNLYNDHLLQLPKDYEILENTEISQSELLSLVQNNLDMMPQQYLNQILRHGNSNACFPTQAAILDTNKFKITHEEAKQYIIEKDHKLMDNRYIPQELKDVFSEQEMMGVIQSQFGSKFIAGFGKQEHNNSTSYNFNNNNNNNNSIQQ